MQPNPSTPESRESPVNPGRQRHLNLVLKLETVCFSNAENADMHKEERHKPYNPEGSDLVSRSVKEERGYFQTNRSERPCPY